MAERFGSGGSPVGAVELLFSAESREPTE